MFCPQMRTVLGIVLIAVTFSFDVGTSQEEMPKFSQEVSVSIVNLYASVKTSKGRPVYGLKQEDFSLYVNGRRQTITNFSGDITEPLNIAFLLDVSGSMRMVNKLERAKDIIRSVIQKLEPADQAALMIFADGQVEMLVDFTQDKQKILQRMDTLKAYGGTALRDAIAYCHRLLIENVGKKGVILLSDGVDTRSDLTLEQATGQAAHVELPIYTFELLRSKMEEEAIKEKTVDELPLRAFAEATGGLYFPLADDEQQETEKDLAKACAKIFEDLKYQYYIGYTPNESKPTYGRVELKTKNPEHRVRVRYSVVSGG
jgi:Ca-activated chloride channel homolog